MFFEKQDNSKIEISDFERHFSFFKLQRKSLSEDWLIAEDKKISLIKKIGEKESFLGDLAIIEKGSTSGKNEVFTVTHEFAKKKKMETELLKKNMKSGDIDRYRLHDRGNYLIYIDNKTEIEKCPNIYNYLVEHKKILSERNEVKKGLYKWYRLERPRKKEVFDSAEKLVVPYRAEYNKFAYDKEQYFNDGGDVRALVLKGEIKLSIKYVLGILNSKLVNWYYAFIGKPKGKMREYFNEPLAKIPIYPINFSNTSERHLHDSIVALVDAMLDLNKQAQSAKGSEKEQIQRQIDKIDKEIDGMIYKLYGITEEERKIIESNI